MQFGSNRTLIRVRTRQIGMLGYGAMHNLATHALSDLYVRSWVLADADASTSPSPSGEWLVIANAEICFVTQAIQQEVFRRLSQAAPELHAGNVMLCAQHTHSAPGGYSHYMFYNVTVPDFQPDVFEAIVSAFVSSILAARAQMVAARLSFAAAPFPDDEEVAFNRSLAAYNRNPENAPLSPDQTHLAIDRNMYLLKAEDPDTGRTLSVLSLFGCHATSIGPDNQGISSDNKGYAALELEAWFLRQQSEPVICIFAQAAAGDVSPNFYGEGKAWPRGKFESDEESARFNGRLQARQARRMLESEAFSPLSDRLDSELIYADLADIACDPAYTGGVADARSAPAAHGVSMLEGTAVDGRGIGKAFAQAVSALCQLQSARRMKRLRQTDPAVWELEARDARMQAPKIVAVETGRKRFLGLEDLGKLKMPPRLDPVLAEISRLSRAGALKEHSWTPQILPLQLLRIGELLLIGFPGEITTTGARRLRASLKAVLAEGGIGEAVVCGYANAYFGYATTPEEYEQQNYEGGHTVFGRWTLPAFQTVYARIARQMLRPRPERELDRSLQPPRFSEAELALRSGRQWPVKPA